MTAITKKHGLTQEYLKSCLVYGKNTGRFTWLQRPLEHFVSVSACNTWNGKNSGEDAVTLDSNGYRVIHFDGTTIYAHHAAFIIMTGKKPEEVDHENGIRSDNRWCNIRSVSRIENTMNRKIRADNSSGVSGVYFREDNKKWKARINHNKKRISLGQFATKEEAVQARLEAEIRYGYHENHGRLD